MALGDTYLRWLWQCWGMLGFHGLRGLFQPKYSMIGHLRKAAPGVLVSPKADQGIHTGMLGKGKNLEESWSLIPKPNPKLKCITVGIFFRGLLWRGKNVPSVQECLGRPCHIPKEVEDNQIQVVTKSKAVPILPLQGVTSERLCPAVPLRKGNSLCSTLPFP